MAWLSLSTGTSKKPESEELFQQLTEAEERGAQLELELSQTQELLARETTQLVEELSSATSGF